MIERLDPSSYSVPDGSIVAVPAAGEVLYRLLVDEAPTPGAFLSRSALGRAPLHDRRRGVLIEPPILHAGVSMFETADQAASRSRRSPTYIGEVSLPESQAWGLYIAKTLTDPGHYTVWGVPELLCGLVQDVECRE